MVLIVGEGWASGWEGSGRLQERRVRVVSFQEYQEVTGGGFAEMDCYKDVLSSKSRSVFRIRSYG